MSQTLVELLDRFKEVVFERGLNERMRINSAGCLDVCEHGPVLVIYPEGVWYRPRTPDDMQEIIDRHLEKNEIVERLLVPPYEHEA